MVDAGRVLASAVPGPPVAALITVQRSTYIDHPIVVFMGLRTQRRAVASIESSGGAGSKLTGVGDNIMVSIRDARCVRPFSFFLCCIFG